MTTTSTNAPPTTPVPVAEHLADLVVEFPLHSEWTNASGDRRTIVGYPRRGDLLLVEACAGQAPVRVLIEDVRREYKRVGAATPLVDPEHIYGVDTKYGDLFSLTVNKWDGKCPRIRITAYEVVA